MLDSTTGGASKRIGATVIASIPGKRRNLTASRKPSNSGVFVIRTSRPRNFRSFDERMIAAGSELLTLADYERAALAVVSERARAYIGGGAGDEITLADNLDAWSRLALAPRMLTGVAEVDPSVTVLGERLPHPVIIAPTAFAALTHPEAETGIARAAAATATTMCLATLASTPAAELAAAVPQAPRWFQLYVFRDRGVTAELVAAAEAHGYRALVVTADRPVLGLRAGEERHAVREPAAPGAVGAAAPADFSRRIDPGLTWADVERLAAETTLPLLVKGILTPEDARRARDHGAAGVVVSNHGGRQLDTALSGADALPAVAEAVGDAIDVLVDGGIRRGTDVVKALALGARAVMVGRPVLWGLAVGGHEGVQRVIEILLAELANGLALTGARSTGELDASFVLPAPWARR
jgi:isopentenyl diphosphate isomerase/L-lactate dehydrogenase-like FMN-dependent dehydrogenase